MQYKARRGPKTDPGTWSPVIRGSSKSATFTCPDCYTVISLDEDYVIGSAGYVSPSVLCRGVDCDWNAVIVLDGWPPIGLNGHDPH